MIVRWFRQNFLTRKDAATFLTVFLPISLVLGRAPADVALSLVAVLFLVESFVRREWAWAKRGWVVALLLLWGYSLARACFVENGLPGVFEAFVWVRYILFAVAAATWALKEDAALGRLARATIAAVVFLSWDAIFQYIVRVDIIGHTLYEGHRLTATFTRPIVGMTIASLFAPALYWLLQKNKLGTSLFFGVSAFMAVLLSDERMALVLGAGILLPGLFFLARAHKRLAPALLLVLCGSLALLLIAKPQIYERQIHSTLTIAQHAAQSPYGMAWLSGLHVGEAHPVFGVGIHQFRVACPDEKFGPALDPATGYSRCYTHPHNIYMEWFSEGGAVGLVGLSAFVIVLFTTLGRSLRTQPGNLVLWGVSFMLLVRLAPFFTSTSFFNNWSAIPFWLAVGWAMREEGKTHAPARL